MEYLYKVYYGNPLFNWLSAGIAIVAVFAGLVVFKVAAAKYFGARSEKTSGYLSGILAEFLKKRTSSTALFIFALYTGSMFVDLPKHLAPFLRGMAMIALSLQFGLWASGAITFIVERRRKRMFEQDPESVSAYSALTFVAKIGLWVIIVLLTLNNLGINITALVAGLGVGGIAAALALQNILGDLFASFSIVLDKPFVVGDFIIIDDYVGEVEHIGIKTTRIRSQSGEQIVFSNNDLLKSRVRNFKRMFERRVIFHIGVTYQTAAETLAVIPKMIREIIEAQPETRFDRAHFKDFGDFSLNFEVVYFVKSPDYNLYMDDQQSINLEILARFKKMGIEFAYPTRTNYQIAVKSS